MTTALRMTNDGRHNIFTIMNMSWLGRLLRLCFIVLFGAMSLMHGPVMTYAGHAGHHAGAAAQSKGAQPDAAGHHAGHADHAVADDHHHASLTDNAPITPDRSRCNAFACFFAVEPLRVADRPVRTIVFVALTPRPQSDPVTAIRVPDTPPPRIPS